MKSPNYEKYLGSLQKESKTTKPKSKSETNTRVAFRLPVDHYKLLESLLREEFFKNMSDLLRGSVELLLFMSHEIKDTEITSNYLRSVIEGRVNIPYSIMQSKVGAGITLEARVTTLEKVLNNHLNGE